MSEAVKAMFASKKFLVFLTTTLTAIIVAVTGLGEDQAANLVDKIVNLAMAYMGGQGLADLGKYAGEAMSKKSESADDTPGILTATGAHDGEE